MTAWLYTEDDEPLADGPFFSLEEALASFLWEFSGACLWMEEQTAHGWLYENVRWTEEGWRTTSRGLRPAEIIRPTFLVEAADVICF